MFKMFSTTVLLGLFTLSMAHAQSSVSGRAEIPFSFQAAHKTLAAGTYQLSYTSGVPLLQLRRVDRASDGVFVTVFPAEISNRPGEKGRLVFDCYGKTCYLARLWQSTGRGGAELSLVRSKPERGMAFSTRVTSMITPAK